ncbi:C40 family peptidase [Mycobacterium sp.]|uniref:C40 family peptidase n=1 Tax=Mycobacterium sp. TaxID=1785 RepID=UPI003C756B96
MVDDEIAVLRRAHLMFAGNSRYPELEPGTARYEGVLQRALGLNTAAAQGRYQQAVQHTQASLVAAARIDTAAAAIVGGAQQDRETARKLTGHVLDEARADAAFTPASPMAQREALRRKAARLRIQRAHVLSARGQARRHLAALRALRYRTSHHDRSGLMRLLSPNQRSAIAVRAALSRLGRPYVWGATGPDQFDCSGLVQWAYAQAGVHLDRTTYQQINDGIPVPRSLVRPGDLVFPHAGHVQLAIGNNLVVEAPYSGASVRISRLGANVQIRRPL